MIQSVTTSTSNEKRKVMFICLHIGGLSRFLTLKDKCYSGDEVSLVVNSKSFADSFFAKQLLSNHIFVNIWPVDERWSKHKGLVGMDAIVSYYDEFIKNNSIDLNMFNEIIVASDVRCLFGIYLLFKGYQLSFLEMGKDQFMIEDRYYINKKYFGEQED